MELLLKRIAKKQTYTIGKLYINGVYFCDTLEDKDRGLKQTMSLSEIKKIKVKHETAIPTGTYSVNMNIVSPKYTSSKYKYTKPFGDKMPRLMNVPGYDGVLIHSGNTDKDSSGCILVGENKVVGRLINSQATWTKLMYKLLKDKNNITLTIQ